MQKPRTPIVESIREIIEDKCHPAFGRFEPHLGLRVFILREQQMDTIEVKSEVRFYLIRPITMAPLARRR